MEGAFSVPNNFDDALPEEIEKSFYSENLCKSITHDSPWSIWPIINGPVT